MKTARRGFALVHTRAHSTEQTRQNVLSLMRKTAQVVSVITTVLPSVSESPPIYHGATLSSFTSVSMHPYPIVSFSLRIPSRMAEALRGIHDRPHMVINLLSASQARLALQFSRPHEYRDPWASTAYTLSEEGIPVLRRSLGALSCALVGSWPLDGSNSALSRTPAEVKEQEQRSELFLARVLRVEKGHSELGEQDSALPLVYYRQRYVTIHNEPLLQEEPTSSSNKRTP